MTDAVRKACLKRQAELLTAAAVTMPDGIRYVSKSAYRAELARAGYVEVTASGRGRTDGLGSRLASLLGRLVSRLRTAGRS